MAVSTEILLILFIPIFICLIPVFRYDDFEEYRRNIKLLIKLLFQKGYCPEQISNILKLYD